MQPKMTHEFNKVPYNKQQCMLVGREQRSVHITRPTSPYLTASQLLSFNLNWVCCD